MKPFISALALFLSFTAQAEVPAVYCISTEVVGTSHVAQYNLFTNEKGTVRMSAEFFMPYDFTEGGEFVTSNLFTLFQRVAYDKETKTFSNGKKTFELTLGETLTPEEAKEAISTSTYYETFEGESELTGLKEGVDKDTPGTGFQIPFKKYYKATLKNLDYNVKGLPKDAWLRDFVGSFKSGTTEYVCGDAQDIDKKTLEERNEYLKELFGE